MCIPSHMKVGLLFNPRDCGDGPSALGLPLTRLRRADSCYSDGKWLLEMDYFLKQVPCLSPVSCCPHPRLRVLCKSGVAKMESRV